VAPPGGGGVEERFLVVVMWSWLEAVATCGGVVRLGSGR